RCRNRDGLGVDVLGFAELLEVEKEEGLVMAVVELGNGDRAANGESPVIAPRDGFRVDPWRGGVERLIYEVVVAAAVKPVGAGLHRVVEKAAADLAVFRGEVAGLHSDFLDGIDARL